MFDLVLLFVLTSALFGVLTLACHCLRRAGVLPPDRFGRW